jgi:hypothetical protein
MIIAIRSQVLFDIVPYTSRYLQLQQMCPFSFCESFFSDVTLPRFSSFTAEVMASEKLYRLRHRDCFVVESKRGE